MLSAEAAMVVGLAFTAMPFADSPAGEAERWLRVLRLHGDAGRALTRLGIGEAPVAEGGMAAVPDRPHNLQPAEPDAVARVTERALRSAAERGASSAGTADVLVAVMDVYGADFERVLNAYGSNRDEVIDSLSARASTTES
jgi:hypothetical protein